MLKTHWLNTLRYHLQRHWTKRRTSRRRRVTNQAATVAETLEDKTLLSGFSPIANDDSYTAADDTLDTLAESLASVCAPSRNPCLKTSINDWSNCLCI